MSTVRVERAEPRTVRFGRRSSRGLLLGLSTPRVVALTAALLLAIGCLYVGGAAGMVWSSPVWAGLLCSVYVTVAGRRAVEWLPVAGHWTMRQARHQTTYRARTLHPRPPETLALPGDAAPLRLHVDDETGTAMVHDPHARTLTAIARVRHPAFVLLGPADQERRVAAWGRVYATLARSGRIARVQVLERATPDSGQGAQRYWATAGAPIHSFASRAYAELVAAAGPTTEKHETTISISLNLATARRAIRAEGGGITGGATVLRREISAVAAALAAAEIVVETWLGVSDLAAVLRTAYDPAASATLECYPVGRDPATAGPVAVDEHWDHLRSDSGLHAVYWISEWPRSEVFPSFLSSLLLTAGVRRTVSLVAQPLTTAEAMRAIRKERVEYQTDAAQRQRIGQLIDFATEQEWADVNQRERELVAGHGDLRFAGFLSVTATDAAALQAAQATIEQAAIQAGCEIRLLVGQQAQAFVAAALPLCRGI